MMDSKIWPVSAVMAAMAAGSLLRSRYERNHFIIEETVIASPEIKTPRTLLFLSDLHDKEFGKENKRLLAVIRAQRPSAVLIGGDTMVVKKGKASLDVTARFLDALSELAKEQGFRIYYGNGNHEQRMREKRADYGNLYQDFRRLLKKNGIVYLADVSVRDGEDLSISGIDIDDCYYRDLFPKKMVSSYIEKRLGAAEPGRFRILLAHSPLCFDAAREWGADLTLSGHFHGGTIRLPVLGGVMTPQYQFFLPYCGGTFEKNGRYMVVSRGLGTHSINLRLNNLPQIVKIRLQKS